jgi:hypothetical protein
LGLRRHVGWLVLLGPLCLAAAHASAAPTPTRFKLSIVGTAHQEWTYSAAPVAESGCTRTETSEGIRSATFRTKVPVTVRISGGKVLPVTIGGIRGTVTLGGANTTDERCGESGSSKVADCAQTRRSFAGAKVKASSPRPGVLSLSQVTNVSLERADCPLEPADVRSRPLGPVAKLPRLPKEALTERKLARIALRATRSRRTTYGAPEGGRLEETVEWSLTFVRVAG